MPCCGSSPRTSTRAGTPAGKEPGETIPLLPVDQHDLRGGVREDVLQAFVRVRQVKRYVRAARADDRDQGDDLFQ
ncbi:hypothetical protein SALBM135S_05394 [Streptomyces alboniger]